ncbi:hypothetical protein [Lacinutrix sp. Bg11-31]|uniref:hypothetical protein n=1 Tax=Lacinutrix sp. Bg11-31 TaxID=2057808 RepID=UPI000C318170|nr:hypothetical protein [Lacinutrix sp. Bg11-31]AUC83686.1 hypothetical protein CW733_07460 [Lacinutrix sp. Bg11-31]
MNNIIESSLLTLQKSKDLLLKLSNEELSDASVSPYYSSIGSHLRHIYDFYYCSLEFNNEGKIDLTSRKRDLTVENCCNSASNYLNKIIESLQAVEGKLTDSIIVIDDLGCGKIEIDYTYSALLAQANSHTIHHYAIIGYILDRLNITFEDSNFGYNPTTPKKERVLVKN